MGESAEAGIQDQNGREASGHTLSGGEQAAGRRPLLRLPLGQSAGAHPSSAGSFFFPCYIGDLVSKAPARVAGGWRDDREVGEVAKEMKGRGGQAGLFAWAVLYTGPGKDRQPQVLADRAKAGVKAK